MAEPQIVIVNPEEPNFVLSEAAELEHMVMLAYLLAAFSFETDRRKRSAERLNTTT